MKVFVPDEPCIRSEHEAFKNSMRELPCKADAYLEDKFENERFFRLRLNNGNQQSKYEQNYRRLRGTSQSAKLPMIPDQV